MSRARGKRRSQEERALAFTASALVDALLALATDYVLHHRPDDDYSRGVASGYYSAAKLASHPHSGIASSGPAWPEFEDWAQMLRAADRGRELMAIHRRAGLA